MGRFIGWAEKMTILISRQDVTNVLIKRAKLWPGKSEKLFPKTANEILRFQGRNFAETEDGLPFFWAISIRANGCNLPC